MGVTRSSAGMQEACDEPATASSGRGVEFVTRAARAARIHPGAPFGADPLVLPHRWPARGYRPAPGGRRRPAALAAAAVRRGAHRGGPDTAQQPVQRGDAPGHGAHGGRRVHADLAGGGSHPPPRAGARAGRVLHPGPAARSRSDPRPLSGQRDPRAARHPRRPRGGRGPRADWVSGRASRGGGRFRPRRGGPRRPGRERGRPGCGSSGPRR